MNLKVVLAGCLFLLAGCQSYSFTDALGAGYATVDVFADTTLELCGSPIKGGECVGRISTETRDQVHAHLSNALDMLDEARQHYVDGSLDLAQQRVEQARSLLRIVEKLLEVKA